MRTLTSPRPRSAENHTPSVTPAAETKPSPTPPTTPHTFTPSSLPASSPDLQKENDALKNQIAKLQQEFQDVLNHSIESDQRLSNYTSEIFLPKQNKLPNSLTLNASSQTEEGGIVTKEAYQTILNANHQMEQTLSSVKRKTEKLEKDLLETNQLKVKLEILQEETKKMIETIRILESENRKLSLENDRLKADPPPASLDPYHPQSTTLQPSHAAIPTTNQFDRLPIEEDDINKNGLGFQIVTRKNRRKKKKTTEAEKKYTEKREPRDHQRKAKHDFKHITILGDSHVRHLAGKIIKRVVPGTAITATCKPGAGLEQIVPTTVLPQPPDHCFVIFAGTNDVARGRQDIILSKMERLIQDCTRGSKVILSPLPFRHDLPPTDPVHHATELVNEYLAEICIRQRGVEFLDLSSIRRQHFTKHGLHLRDSGKSLLADVVVRTLSRMKPHSNIRSMTSNRTTNSSVTPAAAKRTLPPAPRKGPIYQAYESYAEAVTKANSAPQPAAAVEHLTSLQNVTTRQTDSIQTTNQAVFLGEPLQAINKT